MQGGGRFGGGKLIKVLIADDHAIFRQALRRVLSDHADIAVVGEAEDGQAALVKAVQLAPDIVLMDIAMPGLNGIEATRQLKQDLPETRAIALSMHVDQKFVAEMFQAGASGYVSKLSDCEELVVAIRSVAGGGKYVSPAISGVLVEQLITSSRTTSAIGSLTKRERQILQLLAAELSVKEIATKLGLSIKTVHVHKENLMRKVGADSLAELTKLALREGLVDL